MTILLKHDKYLFWEWNSVKMCGNRFAYIKLITIAGFVKITSGSSSCDLGPHKSKNEASSFYGSKDVLNATLCAAKSRCECCISNWLPPLSRCTVFLATFAIFWGKNLIVSLQCTTFPHCENFCQLTGFYLNTSSPPWRNKHELCNSSLATDDIMQWSVNVSLLRYFYAEWA